MAFRNYILLFALVVSTIAGPINVQDGDSKCATKCEASLSDSAKFQYTPGYTYTYTYEGTTETRLKGTSSQRTNLKIQATADIEVLSKCEFALKLSDVSLRENDNVSPNSNEFRQKLERDSLRFAFQDGVIENICSQAHEDERVLNVKRAVLSTFQNSMTQLDKDGLFTETDVSGTCPTNYKSKTAMFGGAITITKTKDILACTDRTGNITSVISERYNVPSKMQNAPLLKSTHECEQDIKSNQVHKTVCSEELMFRPFSKDGNGAVTTATQTLTYSTYKTSTSVSQAAVQRRSSMLFHHVYDQSTDVNAKNDVIALLQDICSEVSDDIKRDTPILFGDLISKMKKLDSDKMMQVYNSVNAGRICSSLRGKQFFYDAIPLVSTVASLSLSSKLITDKTVQGVEAEMWLTQLAFIPRPTSEMLAVVTPLLNDQTYHSKALLGITAMVHKFCEENSNCNSDASVAAIVNILTSNIGSNCMSSNKEERELILITLKAIGNAGNAFTSSTVLGRCITNKDVDDEIIVAALQAFRRMPCSISRDDALMMYQDATYDSELRIHAFLALMTCPTNSVISRVRMVLSGEPVNQVGSFVWTYLDNLKETSSPLRQELSSILDDAKLREDFVLDARKFSRNLEKSFFSDYLNAGAQVESNLIWSQRSYIPRSAMLNLTVEMFGDSINLVELGGRVQGLEKIVEKFFGPNGYFSKKNVNELMDNKRQTAKHISPFDQTFQTPDDQIMTSMYVKLFGNEIAFKELDSNDWADVKNFNILDFLIKLAEPKKIDITKNMQIMDSSLIVPTIVGFPMNLTANATASLSIDVDGNVDLRNIAASPRSFDINGHVKPSASIVVSGMMGIDAIVAASTMKMVSSMHSSTQLDGTVSLQNGEIFNVQLNTPQEKVEVFHVQTEFFMNGQEMELPEPAMVYKKCTPAGVTSVTGMEMCVDVTVPTFHGSGLPLPPFTGPMNAQVFIEKKDTHTGYAFVARMEKELQEVSGVTYTKRTAHISLDTPGSAIDRKLLMEAIYDPENMAVSSKLMSPWKKLEWSGSLKNTVNKKEAITTLVIDEAQTYGVNALLDISETSSKTIWTPSFTITIPNQPAMSIVGTFEAGTEATVASADIAITNFSRRPITLVSSLTQVKNGGSYDFSLRFKSDPLTSTIGSSVAIAPGSYNGQATVEYTLAGRPDHRFSIAGKFSDDSRGELSSYAVQLGFIPTEFPEYQFNVASKLETTVNHINTELNIEFNQEKLSFAHKTIKGGSWSALTLTSESSFKYPTKNIDMSMDVQHEHTSDMVKNSATVTISGASYRTMVDFDKTDENKLTGAASLSYPGRDLSMSVGVSQMLDDERKLTMSVQWANDAASRASLTSSWKSGETHEVTGDVQIPGHPVTFSLSLKPLIMDFMTRAEIRYSQQTYLFRSQYNLQSDKLTSSGAWTSPNQDLTYEIDLSSKDGKMLAKTDFTWGPSMKIEMSGEYNNRDTSITMSRDITLSLVTPYGTQSFKTDFEGSTNNYARFTSEAVINGERGTMTGRYSLGSGEFELDTPYIRYGDIKSISAKFNHGDDHADATVTWAPSKTIGGEVKWSATKYSVDITTPFPIATTGASLELPNVGSPSGKVYWNDQEISLTVSYPDMNKGEFALTYPGHTVTGSFSQNGDINLFTGESELSYDDQKYWSKVVFSGKGPYSLTVDVTSPLSIKKISANFKHEGTMMSFTNEASVSWDSERIRSTIEFSGKQAKISVRTPWRDVLANYFIEGDWNSFKSNSLIKWADDQEISADLTFDMVNDIKTSFTLASPFYSTVTGSFEQFGEMNNFNNVMSFTWAPASTFSATSRFSMINGLSLQVDVTAPRKASLSITHTGDISAWSNNAALTLEDGQPMSIYSEFNQAQLDGKVGMRGVPTETLQNIEWAVDSTKSSNKIELVSTTTFNSQQISKLDLMLSKINGYAMTARYETIYTATYSMSMTQRSTADSFRNVAMVQWAPNQKISTELDISIASGLEVTATVDTPWRKLSYAFNKNGDMEDLLASSTFSWETGKVISGSLELSTRRDIVVRMNLKTPFDAAKDVKATLTHRGTLATDFFNQLEGEYNGQKVQLATKVQMRATSGEFSILTVNPWKNANADIKYNGVANDFTASTSLTVDQSTYSAEIKFANTNGMELTINVTPIVWEPVSFSARMMQRGTNTASLRWGDNKVISATGSLRIDENLNTLDMTANFATPFEGYESGEATLSHSGTMESFRETLEVSFNTEKAKITTSFSSTSKIEGQLELSSPWYDCSGNFEHNGNLQEFANSMEFTYAVGKTIRANSKWSMTSDKVGAEVTFTAPFKTFEAAYGHEFSLSGELTGNVEITIDQTRMLHADMKYLNVPSNINIEFSVTSPWKSFNGKYVHLGSFRTRCNAETAFTWDSQTVSAEWTISMATGFSTKVTIRSPWKNFSGEVDHVMSTGHFENTISATCNDSGRNIKLVTEFDMTPDLLIKSTFTSPFKNANVLYRHTGNMESFTCHLEGAYGDSPITGNLRWNAVSGLETSVDIDSPWKNVKASFKTNDDLADLKSEASFEWGTEKMESTLTFSTARGYQTAVSINTPWRVMSANFNWNREQWNVDSTASISWETGKSITALITNNSNGGSAELVTPWRTMSVNFNQNGNWMKFSGDYEISWETGKKITTSISFNRENGWESRLAIKTPWRDVETNMNFAGDLTAFSSEFTLSWEAGKSVTTTGSFRQSPLAATWSYKCPTQELRAEVKHTGQLMDFANSAMFSWEPTKKIEVSSAFKMDDRIVGLASCKSPFSTDIDLSFEHTSSTGELTFNNPFENVQVEYTYTDRYNIDTKLTYAGKSYEYKTTTTWNNGLQTLMKLTMPEQTYSIDLDHQGDFSTFRNVLEVKYGSATYKLTSVADVPKFSYSQTLQTPFQGYETMEWSVSVTPTESSLTAHGFVSKNSSRLEMNIEVSTQMEGSKMITNTMFEILTPFEGYRSNKMTETHQLSAKLLHYKVTGYLDSQSNSKDLEIYGLMGDDSASLTSYIKTNIWSTSESQLDFDFSMRDNRVSAEYNGAIQFLPEINGQMKLDWTSGDSSRSGSIETTSALGKYKFTWSSQSTNAMCQTDFSYLFNDAEQVTFSQRTTWAESFMTMSHETTLKVPSYDLLKDCDLKYGWDFTQPKKTLSFTMFNDPTKPIDFKVEADKSSAVIEFATPFEAMRTYRSTMTMNTATQPWTVKMESTLNNEMSMTTEVVASFASPMSFDYSSSFSYRMSRTEPENVMSMSVTSSSTSSQWKPHASFQWASDKKIDLTATISLSNPYKGTVEFSSPFENWRSMSMDVALDNSLPSKLTSTFELNALSSKVASELSLDVDAKSISFTLNTPWQQISSFEVSSAVRPRVNAFVKLNGENIISIAGNAQLESMLRNDIDVSISYPFWNEYMRLKVNNDLDLAGDNSMHSYMDLEYMRGQEVSFKCDYKFGTSKTLSLSLETPFEKLQKTSYSVVYSGTAQSWTENTEAEFYFGKITTRTTFSLDNGIAYHQTVNGEMRNGFENFNLQKDFAFTGNSDKFDLQSNLMSSFTPTLKFEASWQSDLVGVSLKTSLNKYSIEYTHTGDLSDFSCNWKILSPTTSTGWFNSDDVDEWIGTWSVKKSDELVLSVDITCPHDNRFQLTMNADAMKGSLDASQKYDNELFKYTASYSRSAQPFRYQGSTSVEYKTDKLSTSIDLTTDSINFPITYNDEEVFAIRASNPLNADSEYVPTINLVIFDAKYEFDGMFKNEGEGLIRDFKLHMNGPRNADYNNWKFQFEFQTQSSQLVPGDMKLYFSYIDKRTNAESKIIDMTADWGNDRALITFVEPHPMRYSIDFSVSTTGQTGTIEANWDTSKLDRNMKMDFTNRFEAMSRQLTSEIDIDIVYGGVSRGLFSKMDWQSDSFAHELTFDYNGKKIGYEIGITPTNGISIEAITQWRNVKVTWKQESASEDSTEATLGLYYDSSRDLTKRVLASSKWERMDVNTYKWTTTFSSPALSHDFVITDNLSYDTSNVVASLNKRISYASDNSKDMVLDMILEKNGKWGIELKQDYNNIDCRIGSEFTDTGIQTTMIYKDSNSRLRTFAFATNYDSSSKTGSMEFVTPMKTIKMETTTNSDTCTISVIVDGKPYTSTFTLQPDNSYMLIRMSGQEQNVEFEAKMISGGYQVQLVSTERNVVTVQGLAAISMNESKVLNGKLNWNPELISKIQTEIATLRNTLKDTVKAMKTATVTELTNKQSSMRLGSDFDTIMPYHQTETELIMRDISAARATLIAGYNDDMFFMKSIDEATSGFLSTMGENMFEFYSAYVVPRLERMGETYDRMVEGYRAQKERLELRMQECMTRMETAWNEQTEEIMEDLTAIREWLQVYVDAVTDFVAEHPTVQTIKSVHTAIMDQFTTFAQKVYNWLIPFTDLQMYQDAVYTVHSTVNERLSSPLLTGLSDTVLYKFKYYYDYYDVSGNIRIFLVHAKNVAIEYLNDYLTQYIDDTLDAFKWVVFDVNTGRIEFEFAVPTSYDSINTVALIPDMRQRFNNVLEQLRDQRFDEMLYIENQRYLNQILPPFDAQAIIAGQHIKTFDKRNYDFSSTKCSYLLARDFHDGNFTVYVNYEGNEQTITVHSNGKTIDIEQDSSVKLDGSKIELPYQFFNTTIVRMGAKVIIDSALGMKITCDNMNGLCSVDMSGYYFAKTGGLLGTYNYEKSDDFTTASNTNTSDVLTFANSWSSGCTATNTARAFSQIENTKEYTACAAMLKDESSPLSSCFSTVNPEQAFHKCVNDMGADVSLTAANGPCKAVMMYRTECEFAGIKIEHPSQCVSCEVNGNAFQEGETSQITQPVMAADIVFIVEEKMCNYEVDTKLPALAKLIESSLSRKSYSSIRFGLVGFGGEGVHSPSHTHTMDSKLLAARNELTLGTEALRFSSAGTNKDVFDAIDFASGYPFRAGANKIMIVMPCSDCEESIHSYRSIVEKLTSQAINLHVVNDFSYELTVDGKNPQTNYLFGIDNAAVFSLRDGRTLRGNTRLYPIVKKPSDSCSSLALQTSGTVFDMNMMTKTRSTTIKSFQTVFANRLALTTAPSRCTNCLCEYNPLFSMSRTVCNKC